MNSDTSRSSFGQRGNAHHPKTSNPTPGNGAPTTHPANNWQPLPSVVSARVIVVGQPSVAWGLEQAVNAALAWSEATLAAP